MSPLEGPRPKTHIKKHQGVVLNKTLDCSKVASNEISPVGRTENSNFKKAPLNQRNLEKFATEEWAKLAVREV